MRRTALAHINYVDKKIESTFKVPITVFKRPQTPEEYDQLEKVLDSLIDLVRDDESHPLALLMQIIGENLEQYDNEHFPPIGAGVSDIEMVKYLMSSRGLTQKDLADIFGSQGNVSKFLSGERALSKTQMTGLKEKFGFSADFFI